MASPFAAAAALAEAAIDGRFAETFAFAPRAAAVNGVPVVDVSRPAVAALAALWAEGGEVVRDRETRTTAHSGDRVTVSPRIIVRQALVAAVRRGDRFTRASDNAVFEVTAVFPAGQARHACEVKRLAP